MSSDCKEHARALLACMQESKCMQGGGKLRECLKTDEVHQCELQRRSYFECRRGQLDMRTRIRGPRSY
ncbi:cytochrome c oxidase assembly protein PET191 [Tribonema minus]|uniref:Cytochrome c oxidase assembly protein PET191 n=1 Tax=Tribonema minus TaxID=303371 RepID=A0A835ZA98_9STRA|nr:cytochrome c oxidase assembly protein PET191 [Tribonema minus]